MPGLLYLGDWNHAEAHELLDDINIKRWGGGVSRQGALDNPLVPWAGHAVTAAELCSPACGVMMLR